MDKIVTTYISGSIAVGILYIFVNKSGESKVANSSVFNQYRKKDFSNIISFFSIVLFWPIIFSYFIINNIFQGNKKRKSLSEKK